ITKGETLAAARSCLAKASEAVDIGLLGSNFPRLHILDNRVRPRRPEGDAVELRDADHVAHRVAQPVGMIALEKIRLADRERIDRAQVDIERMARGERAVSTDREIGIGRSERPEEVGGESHKGHPAHIAAGCKRRWSARADRGGKLYLRAELGIDYIAIAIICHAMNETIGFLM